jgi:hypothetical protein
MAYIIQHYIHTVVDTTSAAAAATAPTSIMTIISTALHDKN